MKFPRRPPESRWPGIPPARKGLAVPAIGLAGALLAIGLAWALLAAPGAQAVEFVSPPGQNVERQEALLKRRITRLAESMLGDELIDVIVHVGYARAGKKGPRGPGKIKLPGFNRYIDATGQEDTQIVPEFMRLRQVFVLVRKNVEKEIRALERDLISQAELQPRKGDFLKVVAVKELPRPPEPEKKPKEEKPAKKGAPPERQKEKPLLARGQPPEVARRRKPPAPNEPESTVYLLRARKAYFNQNYDRALSHILKAVAVEPRSPQAYSMLGSLYFTINWKTLALKYWEKSLSLDPDNREIEELVAQLREDE